MKNYSFLRRWFFIDFVKYGKHDNKMTPSSLTHRAGPEHVLFDPERTISQFDLRSGQGRVKVRS